MTVSEDTKVYSTETRRYLSNKKGTDLDSGLTFETTSFRPPSSTDKVKRTIEILSRITDCTLILCFLLCSSFLLALKGGLRRTLLTYMVKIKKGKIGKCILEFNL